MNCVHCGADLDAAATCARCGALVATPEPPIVVDGRYRLERTLGVGSMGVVHLARDLRSGRDVAVKYVAPEHASDPDAAFRFEREIAALRSVEHPNVVKVLSVGDHDGRTYVAMEYVRGVPLDELIAESTRREEWIPVERALTIVRGIAEALDAVHAAGFVHRDVKPGNVLIEEGTDRIVLLDFGLARTPARPSAKSIGAGTPWYMAPEQVDHEDALPLAISARTDVYALACTAFEVLTTSPPFASCDLVELTSQKLHDAAPLASTLRAELSPLDGPLAQALARDPAQRFSTPLALADALEEAWTRARNLPVPEAC